MNILAVDTTNHIDLTSEVLLLAYNPNIDKDACDNICSSFICLQDRNISSAMLNIVCL